jgi:hypothetical protein
MSEAADLQMKALFKRARQPDRELVPPFATVWDRVLNNQELSHLFHSARSEDRALIPPPARKRAAVSVRPLWNWAVLHPLWAAALTVVLAMGIWWQFLVSDRLPPPSETSASLTQWKAPSDSLLRLSEQILFKTELPTKSLERSYR